MNNHGTEDGTPKPTPRQASMTPSFLTPSRRAGQQGVAAMETAEHGMDVQAAPAVSQQHQQQGNASYNFMG